MPAFVVDTVAVLLYVEQRVVDVIAVMCTVKLAPPASDVEEPPQVNVWLPALPESLQRPLIDWLAIVQLTLLVSDPPGNGSLTVTPVAVVEPVLVTVIVNPMGSPAFTDVASAVFVIEIVGCGGVQVIVAEAMAVPALVVVTVAVLL